MLCLVRLALLRHFCGPPSGPQRNIISVSNYKPVLQMSKDLCATLYSFFCHLQLFIRSLFIRGLQFSNRDWWIFATTKTLLLLHNVCKCSCFSANALKCPKVRIVSPIKKKLKTAHRRITRTALSCYTFLPYSCYLDYDFNVAKAVTVKRCVCCLTSCNKSCN